MHTSQFRSAAAYVYYVVHSWPSNDYTAT